MTLSLKAMTYFTTALRHGNIAKAARTYNVLLSEGRRVALAMLPV